MIDGPNVDQSACVVLGLVKLGPRREIPAQRGLPTVAPNPIRIGGPRKFARQIIRGLHWARIDRERRIHTRHVTESIAYSDRVVTCIRSLNVVQSQRRSVRTINVVAVQAPLVAQRRRVRIMLSLRLAY